MNFFQQLSEKLIGVDLTLTVKRTGNQLKVSALPNTNSTMKPATITGTAEELDAGFFEAIEKPLQDAQGLKMHYSEPEKPTAKAASTKPVKKTPVAKTNGKKKVKAQPVEASMFDAAPEATEQEVETEVPEEETTEE